MYAAAVDPARSTLASALDVAKIAEDNRIDALFAADLLSFGKQGAIGAQEPLIYLAALSAVTSHVGLIATVTTTFHHPYNLARLFGTLDHVSNGRAAWNAVTSSLGEENYGDEGLPSPEERYARATESLEVVNALFDSWQPWALVSDGAGGAKLDPGLVRPIDHRGRYFTVAGPLNIPPLPQRRPVQFQAGQSAGGVELTDLPLDKPLPESLLPAVESVNRRRGRVEIFTQLARSGRTLRELIIAAKDTGHWAAAGTPEQLADAVEERYAAGVLDVIGLGGLGDPRTRDFVTNGLLPELRRRGIVGTDYVGGTFRENLELPALPDQRH
ncbi:LLM class flavin-dependent oxidoreductase [Nocardia farcinica]|nr:LLM class flavin-dependent oxidoreductase [Nocardia farcinica]MBF6521597.1 LLM class flavin-dependent oxidoreductase [Nocardia farcinica]